MFSMIYGNYRSDQIKLSKSDSTTISLDSYIDKLCNHLGAKRKKLNDEYWKIIMFDNHTFFKVITELTYDNGKYIKFSFSFDKSLDFFVFTPIDFIQNVYIAREENDDLEPSWKGHFFYYKLLSSIDKFCKFTKTKHYGSPSILANSQYYYVRFNSGGKGRDTYVNFILDKKYHLIGLKFGC